jgi:5-methylcytosine-specific restriction enzyme A
MSHRRLVDNAGMARSRTQAWLRDELILALDLYRRAGRNPSPNDVAALSAELRALPIEQHLSADPRFRNPNAVELKVFNFVAIDPSSQTKGMSRGGLGDQAAWAEFAGHWDRLAAAAAAIRANAGALTPAEADADEDDIADAPEGRVLTRVHRVKERSRALVAKKKAQALAAYGTLECEACGFDYGVTYGPRGDGFIACHHVVPVSTLKPNSRTKIDDLALVCSSCHAIIHRRAPWLTMGELKALVQHEGSPGEPSPGASADRSLRRRA